MPLPAAVHRLADTPAGAVWLARVPRLVSECADAWALDLRRPYPGSSVSVVLPATSAELGEVVLKVQFPHGESLEEAEALRRWAGRGAVELLAHDPHRHALLLERCDPGVPLSTRRRREALDVLCALLPELWLAEPEGIGTLQEEAVGWIGSLQGVPASLATRVGPRLISAAIELIGDLAGSQGPPVLLHQDLHGANVLSARRQPWLAIDPKPLAGEREFAVAPIVRSSELGHDRDAVLHRMDVLAAELGLDRERAVGWTIAHAVAWSYEGESVLESHLEVAGWLLDDLQPRAR